MTEIYYRLEDRFRASGYLDVSGEYVCTGRYIEVALLKYPVLKHTRKGVWLNIHGDKRFVLHSATKRFADPTEQRALESFRARKKKQKAIYETRAAQAEEAMRKAEYRINSASRGTNPLLDV